MKFWQKLFKKRKKEVRDENWEEMIYSRDGVDFRNAEDRTQYVDGCLEQIVVAAKELELLGGEYSVVTTYLMDTEEVEALPTSEQEVLNITAKRLRVVEQERKDYLEKKDRMPDSVYYSMKDKEAELESGIRKLKEAEQFNTAVKQDMQRLHRERQAYEYRREELLSMMDNQRGMIVIFLVALIICIGILAALQFVMKLEVAIGYFVAIISAAVSFTVIWLKHVEADKELERVLKANNKLIQLQNKVKIKYINNTNLLNYLYLKHQVENCKTLEKQFEKYLNEKEERKQYAEADAKRDYYIKVLTQQLTRYRVRYPERFTANIDALLDHKELVEMRHELILRRQALRKQIEYNNNIVKTVKQEMEDIVSAYPEFSDEIYEKVQKIEALYPSLQ